ncbi:MAG: hypothetical protein ABSA97_13945 [Verrucomicrobiia bacterium]
MRKTIQGIIYDTESDEEICGEIEDKNGSIYSLCRTRTGAFYLRGCRQQMAQYGCWGDWYDGDDLIGAGIKTLLSPRTRTLTTIRPISKAEGLRWWAENFTPDEFKPDLRSALGIPECPRSNSKPHQQWRGIFWPLGRYRR